jgi:hypothetical protein
LALISVAVAGGFSTLSMFWTLPGRVFSEGAVASCAGLINVSAGLAYFCGPVVMGYCKQWSGGTSLGTLILSASLALSGLILLSLPQSLMSRSSTVPPVGAIRDPQPSRA